MIMSGPPIAVIQEVKQVIAFESANTEIVSAVVTSMIVILPFNVPTTKFVPSHEKQMAEASLMSIMHVLAARVFRRKIFEDAHSAAI